jgi:glutamate synthase (NADPH/NADH) large chain
MTGGVVVVLGATGRNFAAGMSGGVAYVYDPQGQFGARCNLSMVDLVPLDATPTADPADPRLPSQRSLGVADSGMGDMLRFDRERLRILLERHLLYTDSALARALLEDWETALGGFVKVMPKDYRRALADLEAEHLAAGAFAAE